MREGEAKEMAAALLKIDSGIAAVLVADRRGELLAQVFSSVGKIPEMISHLPLEKSAIPSVVSSVLVQGEEFFGKPEYTVSVYKQLTFIALPCVSMSVVVSLAVSPQSDVRNVASRVRECFDGQGDVPRPS